MANIKYPSKSFLGSNLINPKVYYATIKAILDRLNGTTSVDGMSFAGQIASTATTQSSSTTTGAIVSTGGLGIAENATIGGLLVKKQSSPEALTGVAINSTAAGTLTVVKSGLVAGLITSTSAADVTITLDSVANIITAFATAGVTLSTGSRIEFLVDNSQGANTVTVAVDAGTTIAVATPAITGGATLTVSTANKIGLFSLYLTSATTGILSRII